MELLTCSEPVDEEEEEEEGEGEGEEAEVAAMRVWLKLLAISDAIDLVAVGCGGKLWSRTRTASRVRPLQGRQPRGASPCPPPHSDDGRARTRGRPAAVAVLSPSPEVRAG